MARTTQRTQVTNRLHTLPYFMPNLALTRDCYLFTELTDICDLQQTIRDYFPRKTINYSNREATVAHTCHATHEYS